MKIDEQTRLSMQRDIYQMICFLGVEKVEQYFSENPVSCVFDLWHKVFCNRAYPSDNSNVVFIDTGGALKHRLLNYNENYEMYPCGSNDDTLKTALLKVTKTVLQDLKAGYLKTYYFKQ